MANKHEVIRLHRQNPTWAATRIADELDCSSAYVRATAQRNSLILPSAGHYVSARRQALAKAKVDAEFLEKAVLAGDPTREILVRVKRIRQELAAA
jgi:hypothetical protein